MNRMRRKFVCMLLWLAFRIYPPVEDIYSDMYKYVAIEATLRRMEQKSEDENDE